LNSEEIKPVAIAIIELCLSEGISQSVSRKICLIGNFKILSQLKAMELIFGLGYA